MEEDSIWESTIKEAFSMVYPDRVFDYDLKIKFSGRFNDFNANVRRCGSDLEFRFSSQWKKVGREIFIGLIQELLLKLHNKPRIENMTYINLYNNFIRNLHASVPKTETHPALEDSFHRVNTKYFNGFIERPNLRWGADAHSTLGTYDYKSDTITISSVFSENPDLIDFIMYHELLHKKHKYRNSGRRCYHHTKDFKNDEKEFENRLEMNRRLKELLRKSKRKRILPSFIFFGDE